MPNILMLKSKSTGIDPTTTNSKMQFVHQQTSYIKEIITWSLWKTTP